jgi:hypothetical protein
MIRRAVMTTSWDDGHPLDHRLADLLLKYGLRGTFYIPRRAENIVMTVPQICELSQSFEIGAHTLRHTFLNTATELTAEREITESKAWVEDITGKACAMFCPPGGKFDQRHIRLIHAAGYTGMRSVELLSLAEPQRTMGVMMLPTTIQAYPHGRGAYLKNTAKRFAGKNLWGYLRNGFGTDWIALADRLLRQTISNGGVFHLWGHSWEIEQMGQWKNLEQLLAVMGQYAADMPCVTNLDLCERKDTFQSVGTAMRVGA